MEVSAKKTGCLKGIARTNASNYGYIEGSVNASLKGGAKQVCIEKGKVIFYLVNDYDVTVSPEDISGWEIVGIGVRNRESSKTVQVGDKQIRLIEYTNNLKVSFKNGTSGILKMDSLIVYPEDRYYNAPRCPQGYIPVVAGWLAPDGNKDDHYSDPVCPDEYTPDIVGFRKLDIKRSFTTLMNALGIVYNPETFRTTIKLDGRDVPFIRA